MQIFFCICENSKEEVWMRKLSTILYTIKMRRNVKIVLIFSISWMFVLLYYFQTNGSKVEYIVKFFLAFKWAWWERRTPGVSLFKCRCLWVRHRASISHSLSSSFWQKNEDYLKSHRFWLISFHLFHWCSLFTSSKSHIYWM